MKTNKCFLLIALLAGSLTACRQKAASPADFGQVIYEPKYATGFRIDGDGTNSLITVHNPWQGADKVETRLLIVREGGTVPEGFDGQVLQGDAQRVAVMSSTHIALLDAAGAVSTVVGVSGIDYVSNPNILSRKEEVGDIGYEGNLNYELLVSLRPDIVLLFGVNGASQMEKKLEELGIPYLYIGDYLEESPLGKAEWMVVTGEVTGRRETGIQAFRLLPERYEALKKKVAEAGLPAPKVMLNAPYGDAWFMPSKENYAVRLITDAGGDYLYQADGTNASASIDMEEAYLLAAQADVWLNVGNANSLKEAAKLCPKFTGTRCFREGKLYNNNLRTNACGGNDYWESGVTHPDLILRDLIKIFHPGLLDEETEWVYYRQLK